LSPHATSVAQGLAQQMLPLPVETQVPTAQAMPGPQGWPLFALHIPLEQV
jgi:hypothetical protein